MRREKILNIKPKDLLLTFANDYSGLFGIPRDKIVLSIMKELRCYTSAGGDKLPTLQKMEDKWYKALARGKVDYSVYDNGDYYVDLWCCWKVYSRVYLREMNAKRAGQFSIIDLVKPDTKSVIDLGCGLGHTAGVLKDCFPKATIYGFNIEGTKQYQFCNMIKYKYGFEVIGDYKGIGHIDLVFASEYFEHIERPIEHLRDIAKTLNPKCFIISSSFNTRSIGHFIKYKHKKGEIDQKDISRKFNKELKLLGYNKLKTNIWNNKPGVYIK